MTIPCSFLSIPLNILLRMPYFMLRNIGAAIMTNFKILPVQKIWKLFVFIKFAVLCSICEKVKASPVSNHYFLH